MSSEYTPKDIMVEMMLERRETSFDNLRYLMFNPVPVRNPGLLTLASSIIEDYDTVQYIMPELAYHSIESNEEYLNTLIQKYKFIKDNFHNYILSVLQYLRSLDDKEYWVLINSPYGYSVSFGDETGTFCNLYFTELDYKKHVLSPNLLLDKIHFKSFNNEKIEVLRP
ncbi:hypothetical protein XaC1_117 [Xanthomonas phage XaC1]|nr:hypothetical protein XaC1_117 [Xanthomonas phage XaC1]